MEVLVTVALLAIVIVPCLSSFVMAQKGNALAAQTQNEYTQAQNLMEELKGIGSPNAVIAALEPELDDEGQPKPKEEYNGDIYVIYRQEGDPDVTHVTVWIFKGEGYNAPYDEEDADQLTESELILKGVIAP